MNNRDQLLTDALCESHGADFARQAAAQARRGRARRRLSAGLGLACLLGFIAFVARPQPPGPVIELVAGPRPPLMEILSDQELLLQIKDEPVIILKEADRITGVVFLDAGTKL